VRQLPVDERGDDFVSDTSVSGPYGTPFDDFIYGSAEGEYFAVHCAHIMTLRPVGPGRVVADLTLVPVIEIVVHEIGVSEVTQLDLPHME
jgi:hypothetical protein